MEISERSLSTVRELGIDDADFTLTNREFLPEKLMWSILTQLALALHYCHSGGADPPLLEGSLSQNSNASAKPTGQIVLHRDIKPENSSCLINMTLTYSIPRREQHCQIGGFRLVENTVIP